MFKNIYISLICRIICLLTFIIVIMFIDNIYTLAILTIFVFFMIGFNKGIFFIVLFILHIIGFMIGYFYNSYILFRLLLIISCSYYFINNYYYNERIISNTDNNDIYDKLYKKNKNKLLNIYKEGELIDKIVKDKTDSDYELLKDKIIEKNNKKNNIITVQEILYVFTHFAFLFLSIIIGSCVI